MLCRVLWLLMLLGSPAATDEPGQPPIEDFTLVQISDMHINPHLARTGQPGPLRGAATVKWICGEVARGAAATPFGADCPPPAFALATGDVTEYGVIDDTWDLFERAFEPLPCPLYVLPGNHDNTWVAMYAIMRQRHGGENYSFDQFGCHFACICSASPQEPVPTLDARTRTWLKRDLAGVPAGAPVFLALHHPPKGSEFAPAEYDTLIDLLRDYNVVLMLYGHGHDVEHRNMDGIDGVMGGSTFGKNAGYGLIGVRDGRLLVHYRYHKAPKGLDVAADGSAWQPVLDKPLPRAAPARLFHIAEPGGRVGTPVFRKPFGLALALAPGHEPGDLAETHARIDGTEIELRRLSAAARPTFRAELDQLTPGYHLLSVRVKLADGASDLRTQVFMTEDAADRCPAQMVFEAAVKAGPVIVNDRLYVALTSGVVAAFARDSGEKLWQYGTGGEILGTPAWSGELLVFGSGDGKVYALDDSGRLRWSFNAGLPVYGVPLIDGDSVYLGDNGGRMHALSLTDGKPRWTYARADYSVECQAHIWGDLLVFGAWDGFLYALDRTTGELRWKTPGPKSSEGKAARYYAPADCGPVALGDTLFVCDRGYLLATYDRAGKLGRRLDTGTSAIAAGPTGRYLYCRTLDNRVCKLNAAGEKLWETAVPAGRFPIPPTCDEDSVYVCSNTGLLSVLAATDGRVRSTYQVTPGFYVMAPVAVADDGWCYVAGMDGTVTALRAAQ
ncbi:MAG: PQQ-binding-like beta-propeller repeat protein [Planctomycetes bacterium]|nr:PQQ-binding-like beta-propeller repeat protein [Planctomycetota bacterium]